MKEKDHFEDELMILITGKKVSEVLNTYDLRELLRISAILTFFKGI